MTFEDIASKITEQAQGADPLGATLKFAFDDGGSILIDGTGDGNVVTLNDDGDAACTISTSLETFGKLQSGDLNPMMAVMGGKVKIKGDMSIAMKLQSLLG
ncbi:MAG: SCP2 sterol-binding domain-containing protein [Bacteroidota bacterium]